MSCPSGCRPGGRTAYPLLPFAEELVFSPVGFKGNQFHYWKYFFPGVLTKWKIRVGQKWACLFQKTPHPPWWVSYRFPNFTTQKGKGGTHKGADISRAPGMPCLLFRRLNLFSVVQWHPFPLFFVAAPLKMVPQTGSLFFQGH